MKLVKHALIYILLAIAPLGSAAAQDEMSKVICEMPSSSFSVSESNNRLQLTISVINTTSKHFKIYDFYLNANMLSLTAKRKSDGSALEQFVPLIAPGSPISFPPGHEEVRTFDLNNAFPALGHVLKEDAVILSWQLQVNPLDSNCKMNTQGTIELSDQR